MESIEDLRNFIRNLKKTPKRKYLKQTIDKKLEFLNKTKNTFLEYINSLEDSKETCRLRIEFSELLSKSKKLLETKKQEAEIENSEEIESSEEEIDSEDSNSGSELNSTLTEEQGIMSALNLDTAIKAIPTFSGSYNELDSFTTIITLLNNGLNDAGKTDLLNFIFHVKLSNSVKTALGSQSPPENLNSLINSLKDRYKNNVTLPKVINKLSNITQRNKSITSFKDHLLNIISDLNRLQIEQLGSTANEMQKQIIRTTNDI